jgi:hypothetical protein
VPAGCQHGGQVVAVARLGDAGVEVVGVVVPEIAEPAIEGLGDRGTFRVGQAEVCVDGDAVRDFPVVIAGEAAGRGWML